MTSFYSSSLPVQGRAPLSVTSELERFLQTLQLNIKDCFLVGQIDNQEQHLTEKKCKGLKRWLQFWPLSLQPCSCNANLKAVFQRTIIAGQFLEPSPVVQSQWYRSRKKEVCSEKQLPTPKTSHKLSSSITTWLFPDTLTVQLQDTGAICIQYQFALLTQSRLEQRQGDLLYIQDQNSFKENFGYVTK